MHTQACHARRSEAAVRDRVLRPAGASGLGEGVRGRPPPRGTSPPLPLWCPPFPAGFSGVLIMVILKSLRVNFSIRTIVAAGFAECFLLWYIFIVLFVCLNF